MINDVWNNSHSSDANEIINPDIFNNIPVVVDISLGVYAQQFKMEIFLNKLFSLLEVDFYQHFSTSTVRFLSQLQDLKIINKSLSKQLNKQVDEQNIPDVILYSLDIGSDISNLKKYSELLKTLQPDYVILQTDIDFKNYEMARQLVKYAIYSEINMVVKSHFHSTDDKIYTVYCDKCIENNNVLDVDSQYIEKRLKSSIITKIAFPEGVVPIN